jgi:hypothetical protein
MHVLPPETQRLSLPKPLAKAPFVDSRACGKTVRY